MVGGVVALVVASDSKWRAAAGLVRPLTAGASLSGLPRSVGATPLSGAGSAGPRGGLPVVRVGLLEGGGTRGVCRLVGCTAATGLGSPGQQHSLSDPARCPNAQLGQPPLGRGSAAIAHPLAGAAWPGLVAAGDFCRAAAFCRHLLPGGQLVEGGSDTRSEERRVGKECR